MSASSRGDLFAKAIGFLVMMVGLAVILGVLWLGFGMFKDPQLGVGGAKGVSPTATDLGLGFVVLLVKIALLFLGSISGSLIANKGIHLYFTGAGNHGGGTTIVTTTPHAPAPEPPQPPATPAERVAKRS
jgi:hypothetical protein